MIRTTLLALAAALALTGAAVAAPILKSEVTVTAEIVTVGDMFDNAGAFAEHGLFRAPAPGTTGIVSLDAVRQAAALVGIDSFDAEGVVRVRVARAATVIDETALTALISDDLTNRGIVTHGTTAVATFDQPALSFNAEAVSAPVTLSSLRYMPASGAFAAKFLLAGRDAPLNLTGRIELMVEAPHLVSAMRAGATLQPNDIEMRLVPLKFAETGGAARLEDLVGKALQRQSRAGMMLRAADVAEPELVSRNDIVTVYFRTGPLTLTVKGQALDGASLGEPVDVLNLTSKKILTGIAVADGAVEIVGTTFNVAGL